jgi:hypothetical protein
MDLTAEGLRVSLPPAWEGNITRNPARTRSAPLPEPRRRSVDDELDTRGEDQRPVAHLANFPLPAALDDFGAQAVRTMQAGDTLVALIEYGDAEVGTELFARRGVPRRLSLADFSPKRLQRTLPDQLGAQVFATEAGRAFCLYVVIAGRGNAAVALRGVNEVLSTLEVAPR